MRDSIHTTLLIGFDRSGSTFVAKLLAKHPAINLIFQPFNSSALTKSQWEIWEKDFKQSDWFSWFQNLENGKLDKDLIQSQWFYNHSTSLQLKSDQVNLIKDTKLHFKVDWLKANFPNLEILGIWRDPRSILRSLIRNDFHKTWYQHLEKPIIESLIDNNEVFKPFRKWLGQELSSIEIMALGIALRNFFMQKCLLRDQWIHFEQLINTPNALNQITANWHLEYFDFSPFLSNDYNIAGKPYEGDNLWEFFFDNHQLQKINEIFAPLLNEA